MKTLKYLFILLCSFTLAACFDDNTTLDTVHISEISIDTLKLKKIYNIDHNETLLISTKDIVSEDGMQLPLQYAWEVDYKLYSENADLEYVGNKIGSFPARLKVSNEHGSSFYEFTISVNTAYQTGIAILSEDKEGTPMLSFMRELSDNEQTAGKKMKFINNCLQVNNPNLSFPKNPTDFGIRKDQMFVCFKNNPSIYMLNASMLNVENIITDPDPKFIPERLFMLNSEARSATILSPDGNIFDLGSIEGIITPHKKFTSTYAPNIGFIVSCGYQEATVLWDTELPGIVHLFGGYHLRNTLMEGINFTGHTPVAMYSRDKDYFTVLTRKGNTFTKTTIANIWEINDGYDQSSGQLINPRFGLAEKQIEITGTPNFTSRTPYVSSPKYQCLYYAIGNNIYRWFYNNNNFPTTPWRTLDEINNAEITAISISEDEKQLYVGINDNSKNELSGSFYLLNSDTGKNEGDSPYLNVSNKPVRIMYKK